LYKALIALIFLFSISCTSTKKTNSLTDKLDTILKAELQKPFNGLFSITQNSETVYHKIAGFSDLEIKEPLTKESEFVVGSISKQFTATLILQAYEAGKIKSTNR
jgi:CubicO group peptidase (beta-lactamase class C family)